MNTEAIGYEVDFLPVGDGQKSGDCITLRFGKLLANPPQQTVIVIDGGFKDTGSALVQHIRHYYKTKIVDAVVSTHPDGDHGSGLTTVLDELTVENLVMHLPWNHTKDTSHLFEDDRVTDETVKRALRKSLDTARDLENLAKKKGIRIVEPFYGVTGFNNAMRVLGPTKEFYKNLLPGFRGTPEPTADFAYVLKQMVEAAKDTVKTLVEKWGYETLDDTGETSAENNSSAILLFTISGRSLLFTGDAGIPALSEVVERLEAEGFDFSTLGFVQVPHHGSKRNIGPTLLDTLVGPKTSQPAKIKTAYASVAPDGAPKHPAKKVTNAFLRRGAPVYITAGTSLVHYRNAPDRGWASVTSLPFYDQVEE